MDTETKQREVLRSESERTKEDRLKRERLEKIMRDLESYDFKGFFEKLPDDPWEMKERVIYGPPLRYENFETSNIYNTWVNRLEDAVGSGKIPVFVSAPRMGKTSIAYAWEEKDSEKRRVYTMDIDNVSQISGYIADMKESAISQVFLDEVPVQFLEAAITALKGTDIAYIINTHLPNTEFLINALQSRGEDYEVITLPLVSEKELKQYIINRLDLHGEDDRLAESLAALSGGCPYIANGLCSVLLETDREITNVNNAKEFSSHFLHKAREKMESAFQEWERQRQTTPTTLQKYIPSPLLFLEK